MKTLTVIILSLTLCGLFLPKTANGQWYFRQYGVDSISELTEDEREIAFKSATKKSKTGGILTAIGGLGIISGSIIGSVGGLKAFSGALEGSENTVSQGISSLVFGSSLLVVGAISSVVGIPLWITGAKRKSDIKKAFGITISQIYLSPNLDWHQNKCFVGAQLTLSISQH